VNYSARHPPHSALIIIGGARCSSPGDDAR
jgi:hypothetical protein